MSNKITLEQVRDELEKQFKYGPSESGIYRLLKRVEEVVGPREQNPLPGRDRRTRLGDTIEIDGVVYYAEHDPVSASGHRWVPVG